MSPVAEWPIRSMLTITEPVFPGFLHRKLDWFQFNLHKDVVMGPIAEWLPLTVTAQTPDVHFSFFAHHSEWFFIVYSSIVCLIGGRMKFL